MDKYSFKEQSTINTILLKNNNYIEIKNITKEKLLKWKEKYLKNQSNLNKSLYFNQKIIDNLNIRVEEELKEIITN